MRAALKQAKQAEGERSRRLREIKNYHRARFDQVMRKVGASAGAGLVVSDAGVWMLRSWTLRRIAERLPSPLSSGCPSVYGLARACAELGGDVAIEPEHIAEALTHLAEPAIRNRISFSIPTG